MRRALCLCVAAVLFSFPAWAQNTDIESLSGLQFNFGNPGARALGMGGAFLGLADDATAAEANPAGLTILRKAEISVEARNYLEQQVLTTSGVYPDLERTGFNHYSDRLQVSFASAVIPVKNRFTFGLYYHQPLRNKGAGSVVPQPAELGKQAKDVPKFFLPRNGTPVSEAECRDIVRRTNDFFSCVEYSINPFVSAVDVDLRTYGFAAAWQVVPKLSVGATVRYQTFSEQSLTLRVNQDFQLDSISAQATATINERTGQFVPKDEKDITYGVGFKWSPLSTLSVGGVYKSGGQFAAPTFFASGATDFNFITAAQTKFHIPDVAGLGVSFRPIPTLTLNADAVNIKYSNLVDEFYSLSQSVRDVPNAYEAKDVTEVRVGGEYFFATRLPVAIRAGYWFDPAHSVQYVGPLDQSERVAEAVLFPKGKDQNHVSVGFGVAFSQRLQLDAAYDQAERYKVGSISFVTRF